MMVRPIGVSPSSAADATTYQQLRTNTLSSANGNIAPLFSATSGLILHAQARGSGRQNRRVEQRLGEGTLDAAGIDRPVANVVDVRGHVPVALRRKKAQIKIRDRVGRRALIGREINGEPARGGKLAAQGRDDLCAVAEPESVLIAQRACPAGRARDLEACAVELDELDRRRISERPVRRTAI